MIDRIMNLARSTGDRAWQILRQHTAVGLMLAWSSLMLPVDAASAEDGQAGAIDLDAQMQLETFDAVWDQVRTQYFDYERIESDWVAAREKLRPQAAAANRMELRQLLNAMLESVGESHFLVLPPTDIGSSRQDNRPDEATPADLPNLSTGLGVRLIDGALIIDRVGEANAGLIEPGWELTAIGSDSMESRIEEARSAVEAPVRERAELILEASANGRIGLPSGDDDLVLTLRNAQGEERTVTARTQTEPVEVIRIGNLPGLPFSYTARVEGDAEHCIGIMTFTTWVPELIDRFMTSRDELFACQGLIIDLRGNLGGVLSTMMPLASHLVSEPVLLGQLKRNDGRIDFRAFPRRVADDGRRITPFDGPVAILIDSLSASTSEMFTAGLQALGRARVFGSPSPGMALPAQMLPLANGDRLMYAFADYIDGRGRRIEGMGVTPDEIIEPSRSAVLAGRDPVEEAAITWLHSLQQQETKQ